LAENGVVFENAYCNCPLCAPARASLLTGRYVSEINCFDNASEFSSEWPTLGHVLAARGYESVIIGKMHLVGHDQLHGFLRRIALETDYTRGYDPAVYGMAYSWEQPPRANPVGADWMGPSYVKRPEWDNYPQHYAWDEKIHAAALAYLAAKEPAGAPFFCCVSYHAPHNPFWIPEQYRAPFRGRPLALPAIPKGVETCHGPMDAWLNEFHHLDEVKDQLMTEENLRWLYETFYGIVSDLDRRIGELLDLLKKKGWTENTAVLFVSDHGDMLAHRGMVQKRYFYERSARVPLIGSFPGRWSQGARISNPVSLVDLLPTLAELTGAPLPDDLPGTSLLPSLQTGCPAPEKTVFCEYHGEGVHAPCFMARRRNLKYIYVHGHEERLYDVAKDGDEFVNLIGDPSHSEVVARLKRELLERFDPELITAAALRSQRNRRFVRECTAKCSKA
jgi:choline-sulfatase